MIGARFGLRVSAGHGFEPPIELRFVDLFMILLTGFIFITVVLSLFTAIHPSNEEVKPPKIETPRVPEAVAGRPYQVTLAASGGSGGYKWNMRETLPKGLVLSPDGMIAGTPLSPETANLNVQVTDKSGRTDFAPLTVTVLPALRDTTPTERRLRVLAQIAVPDAVQNVDYYVKMGVDGGVAPYVWKANGPLPKDLTLLPNGVISGKPSEPDVGRSYTFGVQITDAIGDTVNQEIRLWLLPEPPLWWKKTLYGVYLAICFAIWGWFLWRGGYSPGIKSWLENLANRSRRGA
jgi:hypothetical protein